jgi:SAM-dependent methyltransferase
MMNRPARKMQRKKIMSATANLCQPETAIWEGDAEFSSPFSTFVLEGAWQLYFEEPDETGVCEAIVNHYESRLNAADGVILHLGAGRGGLMETLRQHGFAVMGCEPSPRPTRLAQETHGFDARTLHCSSAENFLRWTQRIGQKAQAVFYRHDWEHNLELQALLPRMAEILRDEGRVIALLPPPIADYPREAHLSFLHELATACTSCNERFRMESIDCDCGGRFTAFVLRKAAVIGARTILYN